MATSQQWQLAREAAERYERILVPAILGPFAQALVEWSALQPGEVVLDVGCGTGAAARFAAPRVGPSGRVIGLDVNEGMIEVASSLPPTGGAAIEWLQKSVYELPLDDESVDVAVCAQTFQFLDNRPLALAQIARVLKPGGRVTLSLWSEMAESPYFHALVMAIAQHVSPDTAGGLGAAFNLSQADAIQELLHTAGFQDVTVEATVLNLPLPPLPEFLPRHVSATPMAAGFNAASDAARQAVLEELTNRLAPYIQSDGSLNVPFSSYMAVGIKR